MTAAEETLAALRARGSLLLRDGDSLRLRGPGHLNDPAVRAALLAHKREILALLDPSAVVDPRPDLSDDAALWARLLTLAWARDGSDRCGVYGSLLGMRCLGVRLTSGVHTLRLQARREPPGEPPSWATPDQYREERARWLDPHREAVVSLLSAAVSAPNSLVTAR
ncbi:MAG: hypothetical protein DLM65_00570 [Candidatus Aeolococcus gillhamiae]|uniref:Uncharacterized protein n=1 Tax=Candidatus Aeolococcus gillhamiae TaxID=3127015 RepID=A0A2W5ZMM6_9BACT|nr:MAG: hypothetical protein DLM65_00570 [Candidatus Dormibacter sp. RRmetagenome_bin12]